MATQNTSYQGYKVLEQYNPITNAATGMIMPNVKTISQQAIVPNTANITYNDYADAAPAGGADGDIWYNLPSDALYKKIAGVWTLLQDRVNNDYYVAPVVNTAACPLPASA
jgi:hypothetical protein